MFLWREVRSHSGSQRRGGYVANCEDPQCSGRGLSPASALDALRQEIRYRIEYLPLHRRGDDLWNLKWFSGL